MSILEFLRWRPPSIMGGGVMVHTDGAIRPDLGASGLAAVVRDHEGRVLQSWARRAGKLTNNEAEYAAAALALESLLKTGVVEVDLYTDSQVLVHQMQGLANAHAPGLRKAQAHLRGLVVQFKRVTFHHIPRKENRLADALANDTADETITRRLKAR